DRRRAGAAAKPKPKPPLRCNGYGLSTPLLLTDTTATQLKNQYPTLRAQTSATIAQHPTGRRAIRAIGLVLLSIAIMAFLLTDADAQRRSSAQGSQAAGASRSWCATYSWKGINDNCSFATQQQCLAQVWGLGGFCRPNPFPGTPYGTG